MWGQQAAPPWNSYSATDAAICDKEDANARDEANRFDVSFQVAWQQTDYLYAERAAPIGNRNPPSKRKDAQKHSDDSWEDAVASSSTTTSSTTVDTTTLKPLDRTYPCVDRWNDWVATLEPESYDKSLILETLDHSDAVTVVGRAPSPTVRTTSDCAVILWISPFAFGTPFIEPHTTPVFAPLGAAHDYPANDPSGGISDITLNPNGTLTYPTSAK